MSARIALRARVVEMIEAFEAGAPADPDARDALIDDLARWQASRIPEYGRLRKRGDWPPALPTDVFRFRRIASHPSSADVRVFQSSGTTSDTRSVHAYADLSLYDLGARAAAKYALFPDVERIKLIERESEKLRKQIETIAEGRNRHAVDFLHEVTKLLPEDAYLTTFRLRSNQVQLDGFARAASELIPTLEASERFKNVKFGSPTTKAEGRDRFSISMELE